MNRPATIGSVLAFIAGYVDTVGFVMLFGLFTAHVTGNFVLIGSELANPTHGVLIKFVAFPAFILAVAGARLLALGVTRRGRSAARPLLALQWLLLAGCMLAGWRAAPIVDAAAPWVLATGALGAAGMGVQNALGRLAFGDLAPTTVMTGNVTQLVIDLVDWLRGAADGGVHQRLQKMLWPVIAFGVGAVCGALACMQVALWALALPLVMLAGLMIQSPDEPTA